MTSSTQRMPPLPPEQWSERVREILTADLSGDSAQIPVLGRLRLFTTVARHERPFREWLMLGRRLTVQGALTFHDRELLILRTAWNCQSTYEWGQHVRISVAGGINRADVDRVPKGPDATGWDERQRALLRAADELHAEARLSTPTWDELTRHLDEQQLVEVPMLVGYYHIVAYLLGALDIEPEAGLESLPRS